MILHGHEPQGLPAGQSPSDEACWWDAQKDLWRSVETPDEVHAPHEIRRTQPVTVRLPVELIDGLKREAANRSFPTKH